MSTSDFTDGSYTGNNQYPKQPTDFPDRNLDVLRERVASGRSGKSNVLGLDRQLDVIRKGLEQAGGGELSINWTSEAQEWVVSAVFGQEAEDSDMAGGASYGLNPDLGQALATILDETGWGQSRPHVAAQEDDGDTD